MSSLDIRETSILANESVELIRQLDAELSREYEEQHRFVVDLEPFHREGGVFVVAYQEQNAIACGALRPLDDEAVELKRMFVVPDFRGKGISRRILTFLEQIATRKGYQQILLETGDQQVAAMKLYETNGYQRIPAFGDYANSPRSVCFAKEIGNHDLG